MSDSARPLGAALAGVLIFIIGLAIGAATLESNWRASERRQGWRHADGTVVDIVSGHPVIAFQLPSGDRISFTAMVAEEREYSISETVAIVYDPARPMEAAIDPRAARWTRNAVAGGASILLMALGGYVAWYAGHRNAGLGQG